MSQEAVPYKAEPKTANGRPNAAKSDTPVRFSEARFPKSQLRGLNIRRSLAGLTPAPSIIRRIIASNQEIPGADVNGVPPTDFKGGPTKAGHALKRTVDIFGASAGLVFLAPLFVLTAVAIKANSQGPVIFRQKRHGANGTTFEIYKFRTMYAENCDHSGVRQTIENDPRVTPIGRFLRRSNFDELPQLINILRGEMSLVGPRPHVPGMLAAGVPYEELDTRYMRRHEVKPGLTGLAQVNGYRGETTTRHAALMRLEFDLAYLERRSVLLDFKIILRTVTQEFFKGSGY
ncbi:sugar transferase [uncultured Roseibium sp.]|uniref:sugar transferase n=1 Tax=uncultured Roseibium sp. TaxID=1936171 RepID=UPI0032170998